MRQRRETAGELTGKLSWRRNRRCLGKETGEKIRRAQFQESRRRSENKGRDRVGEFQLLPFSTKLRFSFVLFTLGDFLAEAARMLAVEGAFDGFRYRTGLKVARQHRGPGDRLKHDPMPARRREDGDNQQDMAKPVEHRRTVASHPRGVKVAQVGAVSCLIRRSALSERSSKFQAPSSREVPNFKFDKGHLNPLGAWCLKFLWCLDVGAWSFLQNRLGHQFDRTQITPGCHPAPCPLAERCIGCPKL
jgi:hypothetical protein